MGFLGGAVTFDGLLATFGSTKVDNGDSEDTVQAGPVIYV